MYFNPQVKEKKEDFFNFEVLQEELKAALEDKSIPLIAIHGLRRTGKTSLVRVVLNSMKKKYVWIDSRTISSKDEFFLSLSDEVRKRRRFTIEKVSVKGIQLSLNFLRKDLDYLNKHKITLAIDEAQLLKRLKIDYVIASIFDNYPQIKMILSGSESGMLMNFLGKANAEAPLYGRAIFELQTQRLNKEDAYRFLTLGAKKAKLAIKDDEILEAIQNLDGIIGWLTKYGWYRLKSSHKNALRKTVQEGKYIAKEEFLRFAVHAEGKYIKILKALREGAKWEEVKRQAFLSDKQLYTMLRRLIHFGFVEKQNGLYRIADPLLEAAIS